MSFIQKKKKKKSIGCIKSDSVDNRSLSWIHFSEAPDAMTSMNVQFLLYMLQIMDFQQSLRGISFQMLHFIYNNKYL